MSGAAQSPNSGKVITAAKIFSMLRKFMDPSGTLVINPTDSLEDLIGDQGAIDAFVHELNTDSEFKNDNLRLQISDVAGAADVAGLLAAIITRYRKNGFTVTQ